MAVLMIYKLDSDEDPVSTLHTGEHIFGRGALLKCDDRRVSRKHGVITVNGESATITSTHQNPCFYQAANSSTITILPKDSPVNISDGDKFALLADQFWFRIKIDGANDVTRVEKEDLEVTPGTSKSSNDVQDIDNASDSSIDFLQTPQKRANEDDVESADSKKLKSDGPPLEDKEEDELLSVLHELKRTEVMSASEDEDNDVEIKPICTPKQTTPKKGRTASNKKDKSAVTTHDAELKAMLFSSEDEEDNKVDKTQPTTDTGNNCNNIQVSRDDNTSTSNRIDKESKDTNQTDGTHRNNDVKEENDQTDSTNPNAAGTSGTKRQWRDRCWYGQSCYRKNAEHLEEFRHPGDSDYESDPNDDRPVCAFGDSCYRRNKDHRQAYKHKNAPQKAAGKRTKTNNAGATTKKRTARKRYDESSEDEYDLEDPFLADSGSEYEADSGSDFDEDESDSNGSGAEEETKRLLKEAKRFTRGKKKDKDDA